MHARVTPNLIAQRALENHPLASCGGVERRVAGDGGGLRREFEEGLGRHAEPFRLNASTAAVKSARRWYEHGR